jgi:hypothetical protein
MTALSWSCGRPWRGSGWSLARVGLTWVWLWGLGWLVTDHRLAMVTAGRAEPAYDVLGLGRAACGDEVFRLLVLARIIEATSKLDAARVLEEAGLAPVSYATLKRYLPVYAEDSWRRTCCAPANSDR